MFKKLASMKFGLLLMAIIAFLSIIATLIPVGDLIYRSHPFRLLITLLTVNLVACTLSRLPSLLKSKGNYFKVMAPQIIHISIVFILLGSLIGNLYGGEEYIQVGLDEEKPLEAPVFGNISMKLLDFQTLYDSNNEIDNWQSSFVLSRDSQEPIQASTQVNQPFNYQGIKFYQTGYGYNHLIAISMGGEDRMVILPHNQVIPLGPHIFMVFTDTHEEFQLKVYSSGKLAHTYNLITGKEIELLEGLNIKYLSLDPYSIIKAKKDPGLPLVFLGFFLISIGFTMSWLSKDRNISKKEKK